MGDPDLKDFVALGNLAASLLLAHYGPAMLQGIHDRHHP
jgi:hypothetical protein